MSTYEDLASFPSPQRFYATLYLLCYLLSFLLVFVFISLLHGFLLGKEITDKSRYPRSSACLRSEEVQ